MNIMVGLLVLAGMLVGQPIAQDGCANVFADTQQFVSDAFENMSVDTENGAIV